MILPTDSYLGPRITEIEREFLAAAKLYKYLDTLLSAVSPIYVDQHVMENVPLRPGWELSLIYIEEASEPNGDVNRYGQILKNPIGIGVKPTEENDISTESDYWDGDKIMLSVSPNGVKHDLLEHNLSSQEIEALYNDLVAVLGG